MFSQYNFSLYLELLILFIGLLLIALCIRIFRKEKFPYYKNNNFLSNAETAFFKILEQAVEQKYYIFPQVNVASLVRVSGKGGEWYRYFNKINQKSVDYVLADKNTYKPIMVVELDDSSHDEILRQNRDKFIDTVFSTVRLPILHVKYKNSYNLSQLQEEIKKVLLSNTETQ